MLMDPDHVPFSRSGRFLTLSRMEGALWLRSVRGGDLRPSLGRLCRVRFLSNGNEVSHQLTLAPDCLSAESPVGRVEFTIGEGERLHLRGDGLDVAVDLQGSRYDYAHVTPKGEHCLVAAYENCRIMPRATRGMVKVTGQWRRDRADQVRCLFSGADGGYEGTIDLFEVLPPARAAENFGEVRAGARAEFDAFAADLPPARSGGEEARRLAGYILWSATVPAAGMLTRPAIYMSKNAMINVWAWDNAFSALGVVGADPQLAFDQFAVIYDRQHPS